MAPSKQTTVVCSKNCGSEPGNGTGSGNRKNARAVPKCPEGYSRTQAVLHSMFMEDAGGHMLDSGDYYGRMGEAYRKRADLRAEPVAVGWVNGGAHGAQRSAFHALDASLEFSAELDERFERYCAREDADGGKRWYELALGFAEGCDRGFHWDDDKYNTYSFDNPLDGAFQWYEFDAMVSSGTGAGDRRQVRAVLVQVHLGCDIRGGYGRPRAFILRKGASLRHSTRAFNAACKCTQVECWGYGIVLNDRASSECEACAYQSEEDRDSGKEPDGCICGEWPEYWKATGRPDGSLVCGECKGEVDVS